VDRGLAYGAPDHGTGYAHAAPAYDVYATDAARPVWPAVLHGAGALASLALVVGIGVWGYGQVKRDVSGVPVVRALEGPMRVAPDQPGGQISDHVGLAVNAVKAGGTAAPVSETLVLAPEEGRLAPEDRPAPELKPDAAADAGAGAGAGAESGAGPVPVPGPAAPAGNEAPAPLPLVEARLDGSTPVAALSPSDGAPAKDRTAGDVQAPDTAAENAALDEPAAEAAQPHAAAIAEALAAAGIAPLSQPDAEEDTADTGAATDAATQVSSETAPVTVLRPAPRPATRLDTLERDGSFLRLAAAEDTELPEVPPGTRLVQIGAFDSIAEARAGWAEVQARFGPLMKGKARVLQQAEAGGRTFWRLRAAGFDDLAHARRFCAALVAERADCIPVVAR
jgi:hypothetical protein